MGSVQPPNRQSGSGFPQTQALPSIASLTGELNQHELPLGQPRQQTDVRDSGNWSISQSQSKHSSGVSGVSGSTGLQLQTILNAEDSPSPSRTSVPDTPSSQVSAKVPPIQPPTLLPVNQGFDNFNQPFGSSQRASLDASSHLDSRRSSVDSRVNVGMGHLAISPSSPYDSQNVSRASLVSNLQQQRGITTEPRPNGSSPLSPLGSRTGLRPHAPPRRAPVINPNPRSVSGMPDPTAAAPTKGFPWAFPDSGHPNRERRASSSGESSIDHSAPSRQDSYATSINSSIYTNDSTMPAGQKRFEDESARTHHHTLNNRPLNSLQGNEAGAASGGGNYSRTPELRISHKMAERKRRSEMKSLFDELNAILPNSPGGKSSKWEILTKSIEHIKTLNYKLSISQRDADQARHDIGYVQRCEDENKILRNEIQAMYQHLQRVEPNVPHVFGNYTNALAHEQAAQVSNTHSTMLPPLQSAGNWPQPQPQPQQPPQPPAPAAMQGVEYAPAQQYDHR